MILTTTPSIEGRTIAEYKGVVFGEVISGVNFLRDFAASIRNIVGGRSGSYEEELIKARTQAMEEMSSRARSLGADAVVGIDIDYEVLGEGGGMLMVTASGTAVKLAYALADEVARRIKSISFLKKLTLHRQVWAETLFLPYLLPAHMVDGEFQDERPVRVLGHIGLDVVTGGE